MLRVLNAFRHQRMNHNQESERVMARKSAQRLSASTNESPRCELQTLITVSCSTPFGINE